MSTERFRRVAQIWNWLPAFRGVAEHESIQKASVMLATSPSALSRTVKLLEDAVGVDLFVRRGQSLTLTPAGAKLLAAARDAMRLVDDGLPSPAASHVLTLATTGVTSAAVLAVATARGLVAAGRLRTKTIDEDDAAIALLHGEADLVVSESANASEGVVVERAGDASLGVYASSDHPLARAGTASSASDIEAASFVVRDGNDGWPPERPRNVTATSTSFEGVLACCAAGRAVTVLPDAFAQTLAPALVRLGDAGAKTSIFVVRRRPLASQDTTTLEGVVAAVRAALA